MKEPKRDYEKEWNDLVELIWEERLAREEQFSPDAEKWNLDLKHRK